MRWFQRFRYRMYDFMRGRYGNDALNRCLLWVSLAFLLISLLPLPYFRLFFSLSALLVLAYSYFRMFSRNLSARRRELARYERIVSAPKKAWKLRQNKKRDKKTHCYFKCPKCKAVLRVPLGKGSILVTCPRCGEKIEKKT